MAKRELILDAAIRVLAEQGFQKTKVRDIAKAAGVADGTIYLYFKNKDDLLIQLFEYVIAQVFDFFRDSLRDCSNSEEKLFKFIFTHLHFVEKEVVVSYVLTVVMRESTTFIKDYKNKFFHDYLSMLRSIIEEGVREGLFSKDVDPLFVSRIIFGILDEVSLAWLLSKRRRKLTRRAGEVFSFILYGLKGYSNGTDKKFRRSKK